VNLRAPEGQSVLKWQAKFEETNEVIRCFKSYNAMTIRKKDNTNNDRPSTAQQT